MCVKRMTCLSLLALAFTVGAPLTLLAEPSERAMTAARVGEELSLFQEIPSVFSASKYEQKVTEAPSAVSIVTAAEIKKYGYRTLADLLRSLRSFHLSSDRVNQFTGVRGFSRPGDSNSRILLQINGHRTNDNIFNAASTGTDFLLDVDLIDRVEIVRGPSSSLYGTNAFFGVINVITKRGRDLQVTELAAEAGTHETYRGRLSFGKRFVGGLEMLLSGTLYDSEGDGRLYYREFDAPETNNGIAEDGDGDEFESLFGSLSLGDLTLEGAYIDREKQFPTAAYFTEFNDPRNRVDNEQGFATLTYEKHFPKQWEVLARASYNLYYSDGHYVYDYSEDATPFLVVNKDEFRGEWWGGDFQATKLLNKHKFSLGGEYQNNFRQDQRNLDLDVYFDSDEDSENWGVYAQDEYRISDRLILNLGVRHDHYDTFGGTTNPRGALIYDLREATTLKLLYGEAFRTPSAFEFYYHDGLATQKPNPDLDAEKIRTYEVVCEHYFAERVRGVAAGFYYEIEDLINLAEDPGDISIETGEPLVFFDNLDEVEAWGIELELEGKWDSSLEGRISYSYQNAEDKESGQWLSNSPRHLAKLNVILPLVGEKLLLGFEEQYTSKRKTVSRNETGGYAVTNLTLFNQGLIDGLELSASVFNLFDKEYGDPVSDAFRQETIEQDGRAFRFKLTWTF